MSGEDKPEIGSIAWVDLTVADADELRDFYREVVGWKPEPVDMGDHSDYTMTAPGSGMPIAGVCHALGANADLPAQWLIYVAVADLGASLERCGARGGEVVAGPKSMGADRYAVIRDPAGAVAALYQKG